MSPLDIAALAIFLIAWLFYHPVLKRLSRTGGMINTDMTLLRQRWMANMAARENRFLDSQLMGHALNSASFFASTNLIVIAAAAGALFKSADTYRAVEKLGVVADAGPRWLFEAKLALVVAALARGLLDFIWAIRQMNYTLAAIGAAPPPSTGKDIVREYGAAAAQVLNPALSSFNNGVRGYYFALAAAAWLLGPWAMMAGVAGGVALLFWRQSVSSSARGVRRMRSLLEGIEPVADDAEEKGP